ncbi:tRNA dimethylallyltransferase-like [Schistocerca americana]|nr:tRNA dimethylallyltransferase-like [Schistocerca americana]
MADCGVSEMIFRVPVVVVMGATGAGKSKLAIDIAKKFGGEVISADSMQVYRGLDIITNKVTVEEAQGVPHHLLDFLEPTQRFSVVDFRDAALPIIDDLVSRQKLPVVVGGTHYYIESLLWKVLVTGGSPDEATKRRHADDAAASDSDGEDAVSEAILKRSRGAGDPEELRSVSSEELHRRLQLVDPEMAASLHPNNRRRIIR